MRPLIEVLNHPSFHLPKKVDSGSMTSYLKKQFSEYLSVLDDIEENAFREVIRPMKHDIVFFCEEMIRAIEVYFQGDPAAAFSIFEQGVDPLKPFLLMDRNGGLSEKYMTQKPYYRMRVGSKIPYSKNDIFHLPFSKRAKVNNQRYSIAGLPCLYLSNSVYVCWKELNEPRIADTQISRFEQVDPKLYILDLDTTPNRLQIQLKSFYLAFTDNNEPAHSTYLNLAISTLVNWPLVIACSLQVREPSEPFKQEYVIPQLLLQWVMRQHDIAGVRYFSNKATVFPSKLFTKYSNYVFPPKTLDADYCHSIKSWFKLTRPVVTGSLPLSGLTRDVLTEKTRPDNDQIDNFDGSGIRYDDTIYGRIELALQQFDTEFL